MLVDPRPEACLKTPTSTLAQKNQITNCIFHLSAFGIVHKSRDAKISVDPPRDAFVTLPLLFLPTNQNAFWPI